MAHRKLWVLLVLSMCALQSLAAEEEKPEGEEECRLLGKFDLRGYVNAENADHVIGGMFPMHFRTILEEDPTSTPPMSPQCEG